MKILIVFTLFFSCIIAIGCSTSSNQQTTSAIGHPDFKQLCSQCHTLDRVHKMQATLPKAQMRMIVMEMSKKKNAGIHANVIDNIVNEMY